MHSKIHHLRAMRTLNRAGGASFTRFLSILDQALFALGNFILGLALARSATDIEVAGFGLGLALALSLYGVIRPLHILPLALMPATRAQHQAATVWTRHLILLAALIILGIFVIAVMGVVSCPPLWRNSAISALVLLCLYLQVDMHRAWSLKSGTVTRPCYISGLFVAVIISLAVALVQGAIHFHQVIGGVALFTVFLICSSISRDQWSQRNLRRGFRWWRGRIQRDGIGAILSAIGPIGYTHAPLWILAVLAHPAAVAGLVAIRTLMQPFNLILRAMDNVDKHHLSTINMHAEKEVLSRTLWRQCRLYTFIWGGMMAGVVAIGTTLISLAYADRYEGALPFLFAFAGCAWLFALTLPIEGVVLRQRRWHAYNSIRLWAGVMGMGITTLLVPTFGAGGAMAGIVVGHALAVLAGVWMLRDLAGRPSTAYSAPVTNG